MAEILIAPLRQPRPDAATDTTPAPVPDGDSGFLMTPELLADWPVPPQPPVNPAASQDRPTVDPLGQWLDQQMGISAEFSAAPGFDPTMDALEAGLPRLADLTPEPMPTPVQIDAAVADPRISQTDASPPLPEPGAAMSPPAPKPITPPVLDTLQADAPIAVGDGAMVSGTPPAPVPQPVTGGAAVDTPHAAVVPAVAAGGRPRPQPGATDTTGLPAPDVALRHRRAPIDHPPMPAPAGTRDAGNLARADVALPARQAPDPAANLAANLATNPAEALATLSVGADPQMPVPARMASVGTTLPQAAQNDPRPVLQQVTDALVTTRGDRTEIALAPEELGRIRLIMSGPDRAHITIWAERPETLELVRRNADLLTQQLADAGVTAGSMEFRRDDRAGWQGGGTPASGDDDELSLIAAAAVRLSSAPLSDRRIDIRL